MGCSMAKRKPNKAQKDFIRRHPIIAILLVIAIALGTYFLKPWEYIDSGKNPSDTPVDVSEAEGKLQVHYIDVGQADSILIKLPTGENILIDAGASNDSDVRKTKGADFLLRYLDDHGVEKINYLILTHPHSDHIASADEVIKKYGKNIENILLSDDTSAGWERVAKAMASVGAEYDICNVGDTYNIGAARLTVLGPVDTSIFSESNKNNYSIVCRLVYGDTSFVFTGDAEKVTEKAIVERFSSAELKSNVLKVGHHGSTTSSCEEFLAAVDPDIAVICCGAENSYGHPAKAVLTRLEKHGSKILRTDLEGTIILVSDGKTVSRLANK